MNSTQENTTPALTPMLAQYLEIKKQHPDSVVFYRMGDFYEMFFDDAVKAAPVLEVQLTSRDRSSANPIPMCGVPFHSVTPYLQKLLAHGFRVAICEQMEDPATVKGLVRREVVRVMTPSLIGDPELVPEESSNLLAALAPDEDGFADVAFLDLLAGSLRHGTIGSLDALIDLFTKSPPKEVLIPETLNEKKWFKDLMRFFPSLVLTSRENYFEGATPAHSPTLHALSLYLKETQKETALDYLSEPKPLFDAGALSIDRTSLNSLEIIKSVEDGTSLFDILNSTATPMGRRLLKEWLVRPLCELNAIEERHRAVEELLSQTLVRDSLRAQLAEIRDLERLTAKTALGLAMPRDLVAIREIQKGVPSIRKTLKKCKSSRLKAICKKIDELTETTELLDQALEDLPPATIRDGGIFKASYHPDIAELRSLSQDAKETIASIEAREKARTDIPSLKIKYSKVFGYTIEITKSYLNRVPDEYIRKQTIANGERFITEELKNFEGKVISADHKLKSLEESLFAKIRQTVARDAAKLLSNAKLLAELDVLTSFAITAHRRGYSRPEMHDGWDLDIREGRHPVIETILPSGTFVPNDIHFSEEDCRTMLITGPNMGGKSTIMRQVALIVLLAHAGSFVPARNARLPLVDAIFTRIGSSDDLTHGRSTFMVEMAEVGNILQNATSRSLLVIDEIGRGTSTYDGLALAWSLLEFIHKDVGAKTLFATHFHELTALENSLPELLNTNVLVKKWKDEIVFLYKLAAGACSQSYGIEVAKLAGLPSSVLSRAKNLLNLLESQSHRGRGTRSRALEVHDNQMVFFDEPKPSETGPTPTT